MIGQLGHRLQSAEPIVPQKHGLAAVRKPNQPFQATAKGGPRLNGRAFGDLAGGNLMRRTAPPPRASTSATSTERRRRRIGRELSRILDIRTILNDDLAKAEDLFQVTTYPFAARTFVRTMAAEFEGHLFVLERLMLLLNENSDDFPLSAEEVMILRQQSPSPTRTGDTAFSERFFPFKPRLLFAMKLFARRTTFADPPDTSKHGWEAVGQFVEIRNRLMHPKKLDDLRITQAEVEVINHAEEWLRDAFDGMFRRARLQLERSRGKVSRSERRK